MIWVLVFGYVALAALVLNLTVSGGWPTFAKLGAIAVVTACYWMSYIGFRGMEGWPTRSSLPTDFRLHWVTVEEPDKVISSEGAIYFWVSVLDTEGRPTGQPRAHRLAFDAETAAAAEDALNRLNEGEPLNGHLSRQLMDPADTSDDTEDRRITQGELSLTDGGARFRLEFREVPLPDLPAKALPGS